MVYYRSTCEKLIKHLILYLDKEVRVMVDDIYMYNILAKHDLILLKDFIIEDLPQLRFIEKDLEFLNRYNNEILDVNYCVEIDKELVEKCFNAVSRVRKVVLDILDDY